MAEGARATDGARGADGAKGPAHRPSKRAAVIEAAIKVFAARGFADASIPEIAEAADLAPTGVYYHFATKDELFDSVVRQVYTAVDAVVEQARPYDVPGGPDTLLATIEAVWGWASTHPDHAKILYQQMPDATPASRVMRQEHEQRHVERAYGYLEEGSSDLNRSSAAESHAAATLTVRTLIRFQIATLAAVVAGGALDTRSVASVRAELDRVSQRLVYGG